jgi:hypothetical protein
VRFWVRILDLLQDRAAVRDLDLARAAEVAKGGFFGGYREYVFYFLQRGEVRGEVVRVGIDVIYASSFMVASSSLAQRL